MRSRMSLLALAGILIAVGLAVAYMRGRRAAPDAEPTESMVDARVESPPPALEGRRAPSAADTTRQAPDTSELSPEAEDAVRKPPTADPLGASGESIVAGRVLDPQGRPLAGIPVYVALATTKGYVLPDHRFLSVDGPDAEEGRREAMQYVDFTTTGPDGAFRLDAALTRGISSDDGRVRVVPIHPSWMEPRVVTGEEGGEVHAEPAASLSVRVVDENGDPISEIRGIVREVSRVPESRFVAATNGGFVVQWRRREGIPDEVRASVLVWAKGRTTESRSVTIPASRDADVITIALAAVRPDGTLVLRPSSPPLDAVPVTQIVVVLSLPDAPDDEILRTRMTPEDPIRPGAFLAALPPGRFRLRAFRIDPPREGWVVDEEIDIPSSRTVERTWTAPTRDAWR